MNSTEKKIKVLVENYLYIRGVDRKQSEYSFKEDCFFNNNDNPIYLFTRDFEIAFYLLDKREQFVFENEYLYLSSLNWWKPYFTKREYQSLKTNSTERFLEAFYEIH